MSPFVFFHSSDTRKYAKAQNYKKKAKSMQIHDILHFFKGDNKIMVLK